MRIAVFYPKGQQTAWSVGPGIVNTLASMGHTICDAGFRPFYSDKIPTEVAEVMRAETPNLETLQRQDVILTSGPEHIAPLLEVIYGVQQWKELQARKANWYHESFTREDYQIDFESVKWVADEHFFPAAQDAEFYDQESFAKGRAHWLPFGVDTKVFNLGRLGEAEKLWPIAFVGQMYDKRANFLRALRKHNMPRIRIGSVSVQDLSGPCEEETVARLAKTYREIGVFFNLPAMSSLLVTKIYEVMACGTFVLTPLLSADRGISRNQELFESGRHLAHYRSSHLGYVAQLLREWSSEEKAAERERIAAAGCYEVQTKHSLKVRLETILEKVGVKELVN